jgi:hypothetical protein
VSRLSLLLAALLLVIGSYTALVIGRHGLGLYPVFFGAIGRMDWPGQFNVDFLGLLALSALWTAWRAGLGWRGALLGLLAFNLGTPFLCLYLLVLVRRHGADLRAVLAGPD